MTVDNCNWSCTKKGPGRRHNSAGAQKRFKGLSFNDEMGERHRLGVYSNDFWKRYDKVARHYRNTPAYFHGEYLLSRVFSRIFRIFKRT